MSSGTLSLLNCIKSVCATAQTAISRGTAVITSLTAAISAAVGLENRLNDSAAALQCVVNGSVGQTCTLPMGGSLPTLAEAQARLNATSPVGITQQAFTATGGQTVFVLSSAPAGAAYLDVCVNGAHCVDPTDYAVSGVTITFAAGLFSNDQVDTRQFQIT